MYETQKLNYNYKDLQPYYDSNMFNYNFNIYKEYTNDLNKILDELSLARKNKDFSNIKSIEKRLMVSANEYILYTLFFENLIPMPNKTLLSDDLKNHIIKDFGSYDTFIDELNAALLNADESKWIVFGYDKKLNLLLINSIEKNEEISPVDFIPLLVIDVKKESYYPKYKTNKEEYLRNLFYVLDFNVVNKRYDDIYIM